MKTNIRKILTVSLLAFPMLVCAEETIGYDASVLLGASSGSFAPFYITANRYGILTQADNALLNAGFSRDFNLSERFSWTYGARFITGVSSSVDYELYLPATDSWSDRAARPAAIWVQELWGGVKFRGVSLTGGMWQEGSAWLNNALSSGDLIHSANYRPIPQLKAGFVDFQNIPLTNKWVQIYADASFGWMMQNSYLKHHYNYYNDHITLNQLYCYREVYFRSNPEKSFSVMAGAQIATLFGGDTYSYKDGKLTGTTQNHKDLKAYWNAFLPTADSGENFYEGQHLGSWDFQARYRFRSGHELKAYFQWQWEDGSGMAKRNGWDGLWGVEFSAPAPWWIDGAVVEYVDFMNQSGPIHFAPQYHQGSGITTEATGADNYYNNVFHNAYANLGMSMGSPMAVSPIFNKDGYPGFRYNKFRGVHIAATGHLLPTLKYTAKIGWRHTTGSAFLPLPEPREMTSLLLSGEWKVTRLPGLSVSADIGLDCGDLPGNSFGVLVGLKYDGIFKISKKAEK